MERLKKASTERFPNAVPENVADALYPAFDPDNKGEVDFIAAAKGLAVLFSARIEIRAQLFFSLTDENGDGKIQPAEMKKFLVFINETQVLGIAFIFVALYNKAFIVRIHSSKYISGYKDDEINKLNDEIFKELGKTELTMDDVRAVVAARWGA